MPDDPSTELLPSQAAPAAGNPTTAQGVPSLIGRVLGGRFTIVEQLGKGGSGEVYRADQTQLGRSAVVKVLRRDITPGANKIERFLREAKLASRLDHPYAAHIYAFGAEPDHVLWIAMEHVRGITLDELIVKRGPMPAVVFAPLFARLCEVVHSAHELGIVHRDIKGANVMVIERAGQLLPKLLDFGIAKSDSGEISPGMDGDELTSHGALLGSPHYMAPEQWKSAADVDARADIYALGVLAYRCLCGHLPFHTINRNELADAHKNQPVPPLPASVPDHVAEAILRALEKEPSKRWQTAVGFASSLQRAAGAPAPVEAVPIFDPPTREAWLRAGPQPIADAVAHLTAATTTVEADAALRELVAITCRWLAVLSLAQLPTETPATDARVRERARGVAGRDEGAPWLALAQAAIAATPSSVPALTAALAGTERLATLATHLDERDRARTAAALASDVATAADALAELEPLLAYQLVVGCGDGSAESWQGPRRRERERVVVWGPPLATGNVALLDMRGHVVLRLSPFAQVLAPLPSAEPELFLLWRSGRGAARMVAAPWGFERDDERAAQLLNVLSTEEPASTPGDDERSPYPGLAAYGAQDAAHFVGREREVETLANRLVRAPLVAVLGPSGVGKSSFIHAGVVPRLGEAYRVITMRPGRHPMHALAALPPVSGDSHDDTALVARLRELGESAQRGLVLVIDQLEELVTLCADANERTRFAETLAAAADGPSAPVRVIATLRDDFATVIESEAALRGRFDVFVLAAPAAEALRRIVIEPARRANVSVDPRVVDDMVATVAGRPASLPLLSFTAAQLWQSRDRAARKITHEAYQELGGVAGALATYADEIYGSLARRDQETVRDVFARLVAADGTRIPSPRKELEQLPGAPGVLAHLVDARLLVVRDDEGTDVVEIVHECLAERWPRLARWRSEEAADRALLADVHAAARRWQEGGRSGDLLWRGEAVRELARLSARATGLTDLERAFAEATVRAEQRARRVRRGIVAAVMAVLATAAGVMAYLSVQANQSRAEAERSATEAATSAKLAEERLTASLIAQGRRELNDNRSLPALAYFGAALKRGADSPGLRTMITFAARGWKDILLSYRTTPVQGLAGSPSGWLVVGDMNGTVRWFSTTGALLGQVATEVGPIAGVERLLDDHVLATGPKGVVELDDNHHVVRTFPTAQFGWMARRGPGPDETITVAAGTIRIYGLDGTLRRTVQTGPDAVGNEPVFIDGNKSVLVSGDDTIRQIDLITLKERVITKQAWGPPAASQDGSRWVYVDREHVVHLLDGASRPVKNLDTNPRPMALVLSATGDRIGVADDTELVIYDNAGTQLGVLPLEPNQVVYALRGDDAWTGGNDGVVRHYKDGNLVASIPATTNEINGIAVAGDAVGVVASDSTFTIVRADATQLRYDPTVCERVAFVAHGIATGYECGDRARVYVGRTQVADVPATDVDIGVDYHAASGRALVTSGDGVLVFERGKQVAATPRKGTAAFEDASHVILADRQTLWRWTLEGDVWERIAEIKDTEALAVLLGRYLVGTHDGTLIVLAGTQEVHRLTVPEEIIAITTSWEPHWLALQLASGSTAIVDVTTWQVIRTLAPADNYGAAPTFDASGTLLLRTTRQALSVWDHTTGEELVFDIDLMRQLSNARFLPDGRIEVNSRNVGLIDLPRDNRPAPQILQDIECKVPLEVAGSRIQPRTPTCQ